MTGAAVDLSEMMRTIVEMTMINTMITIVRIEDRMMEKVVELKR